MTAALKMAIGLLCVGERECSIDHGAQSMQGDGSVHGFEIGAAPDADRAERNAAAGLATKDRTDQADVPAFAQGPQRHRDRPRPADLDDAVDAAAIGQLTRLRVPIRRSV
jgi:hypothetical protein